MRGWRRVQWFRQPQLLLSSVVVCLCIGGWGGIVRSQHQAVAVRPPVAPAVVKGAIIARIAPPPAPDCAVVPCLALTFDDGPDPRVTPQILEVLQRQQVKATFFLVGREVAGREPLVRRIYAEGHAIGNHTWNHARLPLLTPEAVYEEVASTQQAITAAGVPTPHLFRPPYGEATPMVKAHVPLTFVRWDIDSEDWRMRDAGKIYQQVMGSVHPGGIILLHDKYDATLAALEPLLIALKPFYQFVTADQLLGLSPGDQGQYFNRLP